METSTEPTCKFYGIEVNQPDFYGQKKWRFYSLYNGTRGAWCMSRNLAEIDGDRHEQIVKLVHGLNP